MLLAPTVVELIEFDVVSGENIGNQDFSRLIFRTYPLLVRPCRLGHHALPCLDKKVR